MMFCRSRYVCNISGSLEGRWEVYCRGMELLALIFLVCTSPTRDLEVSHEISIWNSNFWSLNSRIQGWNQLATCLVNMQISGTCMIPILAAIDSPYHPTQAPCSLHSTNCEHSTASMLSSEGLNKCTCSPGNHMVTAVIPFINPLIERVLPPLCNSWTTLSNILISSP